LATTAALRFTPGFNSPMQLRRLAKNLKRASGDILLIIIVEHRPVLRCQKQMFSVLIRDGLNGAFLIINAFLVPNRIESRERLIHRHISDLGVARQVACLEATFRSEVSKV
jgi:hypothetical protein